MPSPGPLTGMRTPLPLAAGDAGTCGAGRAGTSLPSPGTPRRARRERRLRFCAAFLAASRTRSLVGMSYQKTQLQKRLAYATVVLVLVVEGGKHTCQCKAYARVRSTATGTGI